MLNDLVERRIREAQGRGEFENLPGTGKPLPHEDDALVPPEVRIAHRILKNAGLVPTEVDALRNANRLAEQASAASQPDGEVALRARRRLLALSMALERSGITLASGSALMYRQAVLEKLSQRSPLAAACTPDSSTEAPDE